jgi:hypothetical protein
MTFIKIALSAPFFARIFNPYRPELHYMRGPGPACRAKQAEPSASLRSAMSSR